ncbi:MAG: carboxylating nicotinate-nucleotide diphosphorylase [Rhodospirillales bacterium]|nr:carboxylating nicotinate-nucleotide diphosphorylase [Rhodospirillales bacterium]
MRKLVKLLPMSVLQAVKEALFEDLGRAGDITTDSVIPKSAMMKANIVARQDGCVAGLDFAVTAFKQLDPKAKITKISRDGNNVKPGDVLLSIKGKARAVLTAERVALNYVGHLSGIATATKEIVDAVAGTKAQITCTRKTTPGLRAIEKYAVRAGGGANHRFGLDDGILIKDNHIAVAGGVKEAIRAAKNGLGHMVKVEVEVDTLSQLKEALSEGVDVVLLDNMTPATLKKAVAMINGQAIAEASGRVTVKTAKAIAESGVDVISVGWLTHSAPTLDVGLDIA